MVKYLVIVESPTKSRTINKFLGEEYIILPSMGHVVDLPKSEMGVDIGNNFKPRYVVIAKRRKILSELKKGAAKKERVYLAMDPDREGEAIAYHLREHLSGVNDSISRVTFHEITERAIKEAFKKPHGLDMDKINAQQARRVLDRVLGYSLSPLLWKKVSSGLSAGRVQSVALRLIVEREEKIDSFVAEEYWELAALLKKKREAGDWSKENSGTFTGKLVEIGAEKAKIKGENEAGKLVEKLRGAEFTVRDIKQRKKRKRPFSPYTTSKLQQDAFNKLRFSVSRTMKIAQELYEGIELDRQEATGLITYMRTDSVSVSADAEVACREYIKNKFGKRFCPAKPRKYKSKKSAQEAHEAIRPTLPLREPEKIRKYLSANQFRLYELIWKRFISSQMEAAVDLNISADIQAADCLFRATGTKRLFDGFLTLYKKEEGNRLLPPLTKGERLDLIKLDPTQHFTLPPPRFSDASLVKALEEKGIGRPSTYAPIISTITVRNYVRREKGYLHPTELGKLVIQLLIEHFPKVLDVKFTAYLEEELDQVEEGSVPWEKVLKDFYEPFRIAFEKAQRHMENHKKAEVLTDEICGECGSRMVIKWGRKGKFLSCSAFPKCKFSKSITTGVKCPMDGCDGELVERRSYRGTFYGCSNYPKCRYVNSSLPSEKKDGGDGKAED